MNYEGRNYLVRDIIVKLLFVVLFVLILLWLFPMPNMKPLYNNVFNDNITRMKDAAKSYFTVERLPEKEGDVIKMTLAEMQEKKMILPLVDSKGKTCSASESYVEITNMGEEYALKTYLKCSDNADYFIETIGCYDICADNCVTEEEKPVKPTTYETLYQLKKTTNSAFWTNWSEWTEEYKNTSETVRREERTLVKGRKASVKDTYDYEYSHTDYTDNWGAWSVWTTENKPLVANMQKESKTQYSGYKVVNKDVTYYEFSKTTAATWSAWSAWSTTVQTASATKKVETRTVDGSAIWSAWSAWSTTPQTETSTKDVETRTIDGTAVYSAWKFIREDRLYSYVSPYEKELSKYVYNGSERVRECDGCYTYITIYKYNYYTRTKTIPTTTEYRYRTITGYNKITEYRYSTMLTDTKTEYQWSTATEIAGWTRTGKTKVVSEYSHNTYTGWVDVLPSDYTLIETRTVYRYRYNTPSANVIKAWFPEGTNVNLTYWKATGNKRLNQVQDGYIYTDWLTSLPSGYEWYASKKEYRYSYYKTSSSVVYKWSKSKTEAGWTWTGQTKKQAVY